MTDPIDDTELEEDFSDLDAIIAEEEERQSHLKSQKARQKKLQAKGISEDERIAILAEIRLMEDRYVWRTVAAVALFHTQVCCTCGHKHRFFMGWMTQQDHTRDPNCRRFVRGRPVEPVPARIEEHAQPDVEMCSDCAESCLVIEQIVVRVNDDIEHQQAAALLAAHREKQENRE